MQYRALKEYFQSRTAKALLTFVDRAVSSVGRATRLHRVGREFEPLTAHQTLTQNP